MKRAVAFLGMGACTVALLLPGHALVMRLYPLSDLITQADTIVVGMVGAQTADSKVLPISRKAVLKGRPGWDRIRVILPGSDDRSQIPVLRSRLSRGKAAVLFVKEKRFALGYADGMWFRLAAPKDPKDPSWQFVHVEPFLRRTFHGTTAELRQVVADALAGKKAPPAPDPNVPPGPLPTSGGKPNGARTGKP